MRFFLLFMIISFSFIPKAKGEIGTVSTTIKIPEDVINLFLMEQYNKIGFVSSISGSTNGITYKITLQLPSVKLEPNQAKILYGFKIESNIYDKVVEFQDGFSFSILSIENLSVMGVPQAFQDKVNSLNIHTVLKNAILGAWNTLQWEVYPMKLVEMAEDSELLFDKSIFFVDPLFSIDFQVVQSAIQVKINAHLEGQEFYAFGTFRETISGSTKGVIKMSSRSQVDVAKVDFYDTSSRLLWSGENLGIIPKKGVLVVECSALDFLPYGGGGLAVVLYKTKDTFYLRKYKTRLGFYTGVDTSLN